MNNNTFLLDTVTKLLYFSEFHIVSDYIGSIFKIVYMFANFCYVGVTKVLLLELNLYSLT